MDFWLGLGAGILLTVLVAAVGLFFFLRDTTPLPNLDTASVSVSPSVTVLLIEPLLNQQLQQVLASEALELQEETQQATHSRVPFKIKLNDAVLDVKPGCRAQFIAQMTFSAWNFNFNLRPVTEFYFSQQGGRVKINVTKVRVRGFTVPHALIDSFVDEVVASSELKLNHSLEHLQRETRVELAAIETTDDLMILKFSS
jgi:hypothetical protein